MKWEYNRHANDLLTLLSWNFSILLPQAKCCLSVRCSFIFIWKSLLQQFIRYILAVSVEPVSLCASVRSAPIEPVEKPALCSGLPTDGMQWRIKINRKFVYLLWSLVITDCFVVLQLIVFSLILVEAPVWLSPSLRLATNYQVSALCFVLSSFRFALITISEDWLRDAVCQAMKCCVQNAKLIRVVVLFLLFSLQLNCLQTLNKLTRNEND